MYVNPTSGNKRYGKISWSLEVHSWNMGLFFRNKKGALVGAPFLRKVCAIFAIFRF